MSVSIRLQGHSTAFSWRWKEFNYSKVKLESCSITSDSNFPPAPNFPHSTVVSEKFTSSLWTSRSQTWGELLENKLNHIIPVHSFTQYVSTNRMLSIFAMQFEYQQKREKVDIQHNLTVNNLLAQLHRKRLRTPMYEYMNIFFNIYTLFLCSSLFYSFRAYYQHILIAVRLFNRYMKYWP